MPHALSPGRIFVFLPRPAPPAVFDLSGVPPEHIRGAPPAGGVPAPMKEERPNKPAAIALANRSAALLSAGKVWGRRMQCARPWTLPLVTTSIAAVVCRGEVRRFTSR